MRTFFIFAIFVVFACLARCAPVPPSQDDLWKFEVEDVKILVDISVPERGLRYTYKQIIADVLRTRQGRLLTDAEATYAMLGLPPAAQALLKSEIVEGWTPETKYEVLEERLSQKFSKFMSRDRAKLIARRLSHILMYERTKLHETRRSRHGKSYETAKIHPDEADWITLPLPDKEKERVMAEIDSYNARATLVEVTRAENQANAQRSRRVPL